MKYGFWRSVQENLTLKDVFFSGIPTAGTYSGYLNGYMNGLLPDLLLSNGVLVLIITLILFLLILVILYIINVEAHKRSLAEILATGYFQNFSGKLANVLSQNSAIVFLLPDGTLSAKPADVRVEINLPDCLDELRQKSAEIDRISTIAYLDSNPFNQPIWMKVTTEKEGTVIIHEVPRTLFAIPKYLSGKYNNNKSKRLHKAFNEKFRELLQENSGDIPLDRFVVK